MPSKDATIWLRPLAGVWEPIGSGSAAGIWHENLELGWDRWGPNTATFDLHRDPGLQWPDLLAFTDVEIEVGGVQVWKGRIKGTPTREGAERAISVQCEGMQYHLDDDVYVPFYVHDRLSDWKDTRTADPGVTLTKWRAGATVTSDGVITFGYPTNITWPTTAAVGVTLDLGAKRAKRVVLSISRVEGSPSNIHLYCRGHDTFLGDHFNLGPVQDYIAALAVTGLSTSPAFLSGTTTNKYRYVSIFMYNNGTTYTPTLDDMLRIYSVQVFGETAYEASNASALKASTVISDSLDKATILLSTDKSRIATSSFNIPSLARTDNATPREVISAVNAFHNYETKVDERGRMIFQPLKAAPEVEIGQFTAMEGSDASQNSGEDIYSRVIVEAQSPAGVPLRVQRTQGQQPNAVFSQTVSPAPANPSMSTDASGWQVVAGTGTFTRTTTAGEYVSSPGGGKWATPVSAQNLLDATLNGTFKAGVFYKLTFWAKRSVTATGLTAVFGDLTTQNSSFTDAISTTTAFQLFTLEWTPTDDVTTAKLRFETAATTDSFYFDDVAVWTSASTIVDRRGFRRTKILPVSASMSSDGVAMAAIGDAYLSTHKQAQFKGEYQVTGPLKNLLTGATVPPELLGLRTNELIRFNDKVDPDTGAIGRDGRIASVTYRLTDDTASFAVDNTSQNFEALLARLGALSGGG